MTTTRPILSAALLLTAALSAAACTHEKPLIVQTIRLPAALDGHAYETEVVLDDRLHVSPDWTIPRNSNFKIEPIQDGSGAYNRFILRHSGKDYLYDGLKESRYEILKLHGHSGGGSAYREHLIELQVQIVGANDPNLQYCTLLQPKAGIRMYDCSRLYQIRTEAAQDGTFCRKFPRECGLPQ